MYQQLKAAREKESGFTLIELLIVIVILGVLAGIVVFAVGGINDTSKQSACKSDVKNVEIAAESYFAQNKKYASNVAQLVNSKLLREAPDASEGIQTYGTDPTDTTAGGAAGSVSHTCSYT